ncbi:MAG TPA: M57 family metalloprotease, partial [Thermoanaerobaculia bacterium]|nr:M57 family metalloprotease [Thermoanaerobaculia bacterium]
MMLFALAVPLSAATYLVPSDAEMIQRSDDIVVATAVASTVERTARGGIVTRYVLRVEEVLKGQRSPGGYLTVTQLGGQLADLALVVSGSPVYEPGERYLVFTDADDAGEPITFGAELGQFRFEPDVAGRMLAVRAEIHGYDGNLEPFRDGLRDARRFKEYIRGIVGQRVDPAPDYFVPPSRRMQTNGEVGALAFSRGSYTMDGNPRWQGPAAALVTSGTQPGISDGGVGSVNNGIAAWNGTGDINYSYAGQDDTAVGGFQAHDSKDAVLFNDPNNEVEAGIAARGGFWSTGATHILDGETFRNIDGGVDVIVNDVGHSSACLLDIMTHELGHTLGIRHSNQPKAGTSCGTTADCSSDAIMNSTVFCNAGGQLKTWDLAALSVIYGAGPICTEPAITQNPTSTTINAGQSANLTVTATGTAPLTYQWFIGTPADTSQPTGTNSATLNVSPATTTTYWVRVTGSCGSPVNSTAATVTVNPVTCTPPAISSQPTSRTITSGEFTTLTVGATGTEPLTYQWFVGTPSNTSTPIGTNSPNLTVNPTTTTSYWVRVTGQCGSPAESVAATVTVNPVACTPPSILSHPTDRTITSGQLTTLTVGATGTAPLTYQWFVGTPTNTSTPIGANSPNLTVNPTVNTTYWVRVTGQCGSPANSNAATVTVSAPTCPLIDVGAPTATLQGTSYLLSVNAVSGGRSLTFQWFRGNTPGTGGTPVGTTQQVSVPVPTAATSYWVRVTNDCGNFANSTTVTVTPASCPGGPPSITTQPQDLTILSGGTATLTVAFTSSSATTVRWYR